MGEVIAALYVETAGAYFGLPAVEPWDEPKDARRYTGPWPVVAHPPCQRWGRYWHGAPNKPHEYRLGEDGGKDKTRIRNATPPEFRNLLLAIARSKLITIG